MKIHTRGAYKLRWKEPDAQLAAESLDQQIEIMAEHVHWAHEWIEDSDDHNYALGAKEAIGHMVACWLTQVVGYDCCETAYPVGVLFDTPAKNLKGWERKIRQMVANRKERK
jgi:hypothetical protein